MAGNIQPLPDDVRSRLRSLVTITLPQQAVEELVLNAIDAGASCIAVRVDLGIHRLQVVDNGCGITRENLKLVGKRYTTSKCHSLDDLTSRLHQYGFRGEALASLAEVTAVLEITSRCQAVLQDSKICDAFSLDNDDSECVRSKDSFCSGKGRMRRVVSEEIADIGMKCVSEDCHDTTVASHKQPSRRKKVGSKIYLKKRDDRLLKNELCVSDTSGCSGFDESNQYNGYNNTYTKTFLYGKARDVEKAVEQRPSIGTTVTAQEFMYCMPIRRKMIKETIDLENIRSRLVSLALIHPQVAFSLRSEKSSSTNVLLQTKKCVSTLAAARHIFGDELADGLAEVNHSLDPISVTGYIGTQPSQSKNLQFIYINRRLVLNTKIHKFMNGLMSKSAIVSSRLQKVHYKSPIYNRSPSSPPKGLKLYGVFILNLECPLEEYDVLLDPAKTLVEFRNWTRVLRCLEEAVVKFGNEENIAISLDHKYSLADRPKLIMGSEEEERDNGDDYDEDDDESPIVVRTQQKLKMFTRKKRPSSEEYAKPKAKYGKLIGVSNIQSSVLGHIVHRPKTKSQDLSIPNEMAEASLISDLDLPVNINSNEFSKDAIRSSLEEFRHDIKKYLDNLIIMKNSVSCTQDKCLSKDKIQKSLSKNRQSTKKVHEMSCSESSDDETGRVAVVRDTNIEKEAMHLSSKGDIKTFSEHSLDPSNSKMIPVANSSSTKGQECTPGNGSVKFLSSMQDFCLQYEKDNPSNDASLLRTPVFPPVKTPTSPPLLKSYEAQSTSSRVLSNERPKLMVINEGKKQVPVPKKQGHRVYRKRTKIVDVGTPLNRLACQTMTQILKSHLRKEQSRFNALKSLDKFRFVEDSIKNKGCLALKGDDEGDLFESLPLSESQTWDELQKSFHFSPVILDCVGSVEKDSGDAAVVSNIKTNNCGTIYPHTHVNPASAVRSDHYAKQLQKVATHGHTFSRRHNDPVSSVVDSLPSQWGSCLSSGGLVDTTIVDVSTGAADCNLARKLSALKHTKNLPLKHVSIARECDRNCTNLSGQSYFVNNTRIDNNVISECTVLGDEFLHTQNPQPGNLSDDLSKQFLRQPCSINITDNSHTVVKKDIYFCDQVRTEATQNSLINLDKSDSVPESSTAERNFPSTQAPRCSPEIHDAAHSAILQAKLSDSSHQVTDRLLSQPSQLRLDNSSAYAVGDPSSSSPLYPSYSSHGYSDKLQPSCGPFIQTFNSHLNYEVSSGKAPHPSLPAICKDTSFPLATGSSTGVIAPLLLDSNNAAVIDSSADSGNSGVYAGGVSRITSNSYLVTGDLVASGCCGVLGDFIPVTTNSVLVRDPRLVSGNIERDSSSMEGENVASSPEKIAHDGINGLGSSQCEINTKDLMVDLPCELNTKDIMVNLPCEVNTKEIMMDLPCEALHQLKPRKSYSLVKLCVTPFIHFFDQNINSNNNDILASCSDNSVASIAAGAYHEKGFISETASNDSIDMADSTIQELPSIGCCESAETNIFSVCPAKPGDGVCQKSLDASAVQKKMEDASKILKCSLKTTVGGLTMKTTVGDLTMKTTVGGLTKKTTVGGLTKNAPEKGACLLNDTEQYSASVCDDSQKDNLKASNNSLWLTQKSQSSIQSCCETEIKDTLENELPLTNEVANVISGCTKENTFFGCIPVSEATQFCKLNSATQTHQVAANDSMATSNSTLNISEGKCQEYISSCKRANFRTLSEKLASKINCGATANTAETEHNVEFMAQKNEWKETKDSEERTVYINLRSGNSSYFPPLRNTDEHDSHEMHEPVNAHIQNIPITAEPYSVSRDGCTNIGSFCGSREFSCVGRDRISLSSKLLSERTQQNKQLEEDLVSPLVVYDDGELEEEREKGQGNEALPKEVSSETTTKNEVLSVELIDIEKAIENFHKESDTMVDDGVDVCSTLPQHNEILPQSLLNNSEAMSKMDQAVEEICARAKLSDVIMEADVLRLDTAIAEGCGPRYLRNSKGVPVFQGNNAFKLTKEMLYTCKVLGQLDEKFIVCSVSYSPDTAEDISPADPTLLQVSENTISLLASSSIVTGSRPSAKAPKSSEKKKQSISDVPNVLTRSDNVASMTPNDVSTDNFKSFQVQPTASSSSTAPPSTELLSSKLPCSTSAPRSLTSTSTCSTSELKCSTSTLMCSTSALSSTPLLVLFDQHAVHERIRLEVLMAATLHTGDDGGRLIKSWPVSPPLMVDGLHQGDLRIMEMYRDVFKGYGLEFEKSYDGGVLFGRIPALLFPRSVVTHALSRGEEEHNCAGEEEEGESLSSVDDASDNGDPLPSSRLFRPSTPSSLNRLPPSTSSSPFSPNTRLWRQHRCRVVRGVVLFVCDTLRRTRTVSTAHATVPPPLQHLLNTQACRGAIRFGQRLSRAQCTSLVRRLSRCALPFQCAHGRPGAVPLCTLQQFKYRLQPPNLQRLKARMQGQPSPSEGVGPPLCPSP